MKNNFDVDVNYYRNAVKKACIDTLEESATIAVAETQLRTPVKTGALRRSMTHSDVDTLKMSVDIGSSLEYAKFVEEGHTQKAGKHINGRWMIHDGITVANNEMPKMLRKKLQEKFGNDKV